MTHEKVIAAAWAAYLKGESFVVAFRRIWSAAPSTTTPYDQKR